jgi:ATP-dependent DNA helicase RecG
MDLQQSIKDAGKLYKLYAKRLEKLNINTLEDFLYHIPFRYEDYSKISKIKNIKPLETVTIQGTVAKINQQFTKNFKKIQKITVSDGTGEIEVVWFNQPYLTKIIKVGDKISLSGKIDWFSRKLTMQSPEYETFNISNNIHTGRLVPVYPETKGVSSKWLRRQVYKILQNNKNNFTEYLPDEMLRINSLINFSHSISQIHFPDNFEAIQRSKKRLSFDEFFLLHLSSIQKKHDWTQNMQGSKYETYKFNDTIKSFFKSLPFNLTNAQKQAIREIFADLKKEKPMNRLLQGDVGSGKTVVAASSIFLSFLNGFQSALMAPTEILANQHFSTISKLLSPFGVKVKLTTSSNRKTLSSELRAQSFSFDVIVGTHALLYDKINFENLGLVVIDEQQRFGVEQRSIIRNKGRNPHLLTMTATPIPRTIALTLYGDLDLSALNEMPVGRKTVKTWMVPADKRFKAYEWIEKQLKNTKSQAFIVCPFIEESETMQTVRAANKEFEELQKKIFKNLKLDLLHGKLKSKEKDSVLQNFKDKKTDILIATPVVEVGIDFPNATIIVIEASERFGLSQLHQLRGRVGRGDKQSYCLLFSDSQNPQTIQRLKALERHNTGSELAELDLKIRGSGDIYGTMQHGRKVFKIADFSDFDLIKRTKTEAEKIFPNLHKYPKLIEKLKSISTRQISPD